MHVWFVGSITKEGGKNLMHTLIVLKQGTMSTSIFEQRKFTAFPMDMKLLTHRLMVFDTYSTQGTLLRDLFIFLEFVVAFSCSRGPFSLMKRILSFSAA